jgi:methionyl-tRNA formyltransferase
VQERIVRIIFATTGGPLALDSLTALACDHQIAAVVLPEGGWRARAAGMVRRRPALGDDAAAWSAQRGIPVIRCASRRDPRLLQGLARLAPDLLCVALFPWVLPAEVLQFPARGVVNLHPSLLPRHRGANPFFWTYYHDDRETGITLHVATARADSGPILAQRRWPLARGLPVEQAYLQASAAGGDLFRIGLIALANGISPVEQDETSATRAPSVRPGMAMVAFDSWSAERVWHFLAGMCGRFHEPLLDERGRPVQYRSVHGYDVMDPLERPGIVTRGDHGWELWCRDGRVHLSAVAAGRAAPA